MHHVGEAGKGRLGANGNPAGEALQPHHSSQSRQAMNSRAKGDATGVSLSPENLHTFLIFPLPKHPYLQADKGKQAAFPEGKRASLNVTCIK